MKIGIIRTSSIGDVVLATACLDYLGRVAPDAQIFWVGRNPSLSLIRGAWPRIIPVELPSRSNRRQVKDVIKSLSACDAVIDLQTSFRSRVLSRAIKKNGVPVFPAKKSTWFRARLVLNAWFRGRWALLPAAVQRAEKAQFEMMLDAARSCAASLGISKYSELVPAIPTLKVDHVSVRELTWVRELGFGEWLAIAPGASHATKRAPTEVFADVLTSLESGWQKTNPLPGLLFLGGNEDRKASLDLLDQIKWDAPVINLAGKLSLDQTMFALSKVKCLLSNDSGLAHISEAVGRPVAVLFGPTVEGFGFSPRHPASKAFSSRVGCRPCSKHGKKPCVFDDMLCFRAIDTVQVGSFLRDTLTAGDKP